MTLLRLAEEEHGLLVTLHHIASDGWSHDVLFGELAALYEAFRAGRSSPLPELPIQYADYAVWQRAELQGDFLESLLDYWRRQLESAGPAGPANGSAPAGRRIVPRRRLCRSRYPPIWPVDWRPSAAPKVRRYS